MSKQQIAETQIIVTLPEMWDFIMRKSTNTSFTNLLQLIIIAKIYLLYDEHGPVLESAAVRTIRHMEQDEYIGLVGLWSTLLNYQDAATFLQVNKLKSLFYFGSSY